MNRRAEISGAGFAGLTAAVVLLQNGWSVRVHERSHSLRSEGFGIGIQGNALRVFEALGVVDQLIPYSVRMLRRIVRDASGGVTSFQVRNDQSSYRMSREKIVSVLAERVASLGGEIVTGSAVVGAGPDGSLILDNGTRLHADLIIGADGYASKVVETSGLLQRRIMLRDGAMRLVIPRLGSEMGDNGSPETGEITENWSAARRVITSPCSPTEVYVAMSCGYCDDDAMAVPVRHEAWRKSFPYLSSVFDRIAAATDWSRVKWVRFQIVKLRTWSRGRIAVVGDAAHAMPPNLGQGGGTALVNAFALASAVVRDYDIERALATWEASERPTTDHTQLWSRLYGTVTFWPESLRGLAFRTSTRSKWMQKQLTRAANHVPLGLESYPRRTRPGTSLLYAPSNSTQPADVLSANNLISFEKVSVRFGEETVYSGIDLNVKEGEFLCLLGPSGCGKSTALRLLAGLLPCDSGRITIGGAPPSERWREMAFVFQGPRLLPWRTAKDNVMLGMELRQLKLDRAQMAARADEFLALVGLGQDGHKYPSMLSGGERQRVSLARALAVDPLVILMDEPFSALDPATRRRMRTELVSVWQQTSKTIIFVTHDIDEAVEMADRVVLLSTKPTRIIEEVVVTEKRPRDMTENAALIALKNRIVSLFPDQHLATSALIA
jgi:ABC-type nitrate/sulfonate/bicarbonate transport system ATPase subunit/2-polyprenyl-6-methoxyphenol hydroxylase-like FAD-dependent oxidoreductase